MKNNEIVESVNLKMKLQSDNVFVKQQIVNLSSRRGAEKAIVSENQVVNVVSKSYGHLPNENFFPEVEAKLVESRIGYITRSSFHNPVKLFRVSGNIFTQFETNQN